MDSNLNNSNNHKKNKTEGTASVIDNNTSKKIKNKSKKKKAPMILAIVLIVFSLPFAFAGGYLIATFDKLVYEHELVPTEFDQNAFKPEGEVDPENHAHENPEIGKRFDKVSSIPVYGNTHKITNILLLGIDANDGTMIGRSDAIMILTLNHDTREIKLTSILRDTMVVIPGRDNNGDGKDDYDKLNHAYAYGGGHPGLLIETIEYNFRIKIEDYISVNFKAFKNAVDAFNGIDMDLSAAEAKQVGIGSTAKKYHLNGEQALAYSRIRYIDSDFARTNRQRNVITALLTKAKKMNLFQIDKMINVVFPQVKTNMSANDLISFVTYSSYNLGETYHLPEEGGYTSHIYSIGYIFQLENPAESVGKLHDFIYK